MRKFSQIIFLMVTTTTLQANPGLEEEDSSILLNTAKALGKPKHIRSEISFSQGVISGCTAGVLDVVINHPLWAIKIMMQNGESLSFKPQSLYRGLVSNTLTMIPLTASRVAISSFLQKKSHNAHEDDSPTKMILSSFVGGMFPSLFGGPTELLRNLEHKNKMTFRETYRNYIDKKGYIRLFRGTPGVAIRDGIYTTSFSALTPLIRNYFEKERGIGADIAPLFAGVTSGLIAAVASHPFDTIKVIQQARSMEQDLSMLKTIKLCYETEGNSWINTTKRIFRGMVPRGIRTISGVVVISNTTSYLNSFFDKLNNE
ncbi:MAG: hypothetical protein KBC28_10330 [Alphaproteobacteria bacterium]|nr:hypothetical protein [Alphaproteobacteria bacterium]